MCIILILRGILQDRLNTRTLAPNSQAVNEKKKKEKILKVIKSATLNNKKEKKKPYY